MPALTSLSDCYTPQTLPTNNNEVSIESKERIGGRGPLELRRLTLQTGFLSSANGSSMVQLGKTKVLCKVIGPLTDVPSSVDLQPEEGVLQVQAQFMHQAAPIMSRAVQSSSSSAVAKLIKSQEMYLESRILAAVEAAVPLDAYPMCLIQLHLTVLGNHGSLLTCALTAACLALIDAKVDMLDVICASNVVVKGNTILADPDLQEEQNAEATVRLSLLPSPQQTLQFQQSGRMPPKLANEALQVCRDGCRTMHQFIRKHVVEKLQQESREDAMVE